MTENECSCDMQVESGGSALSSQRRGSAKSSEAERREANEAARKEVKQQQDLIQKLRRENESLKDDLGLSKEALSTSTTDRAITQLSKLQEDANTYARRLDQEQKKAQALEKEKERADQHALQMRRRMGGVDAQQEAVERCRRKIHILEYKVDREVRRLNEVVAQNRKLRQEIDNVRLERKIFSELYERKEKELEQCEAEVEEVAEQRESAADEMDQYKNELAALQAQADKEHVEYETKWRELGALLEDSLEREQETRNRAAEYLGSKEHMMEREAKLKKKRIGRQAQKRKDKQQDRNQDEQRQDKVDRIRKCVERVMAEEVDVPSLDALVDRFISNEDRNDSLFNYVNDLNQEADNLEDEIAQLENVVAELQQNPSDSQRRQSTIQDLQSKAENSNNQAEQYDSLASSSISTIEAIKEKVKDICQQHNCEPGTSSFTTSVCSNGSGL